MRIALGSDHAGFELKEKLAAYLNSRGEEVKDFGTFDNGSVDYPDIALAVSDAVAQGECERGILVCGTGLGMSISANKVSGIRAAACTETFGARHSRLHNDANVLCLGSRIIGPGLAEEITQVWLDTGFEGGRHARRVDKIMDIERKSCGG